jgi:hypothetical protein
MKDSLLESEVVPLTLLALFVLFCILDAACCGGRRSLDTQPSSPAGHSLSRVPR